MLYLWGGIIKKAGTLRTAVNCELGPGNYLFRCKKGSLLTGFQKRQAVLSTGNKSADRLSSMSLVFVV